MTCMTALAQPMAMAQLVRVIRYEVSAPRKEQNTGHTPRMNWVVNRRRRQPRVPHAMGGRGRLLRANKRNEAGRTIMNTKMLTMRPVSCVLVVLLVFPTVDGLTWEEESLGWLVIRAARRRNSYSQPCGQRDQTNHNRQRPRAVFVRVVALGRYELEIDSPGVQPNEKIGW
jgi:hypothetical protein